MTLSLLYGLVLTVCTKAQNIWKEQSLGMGVGTVLFRLEMYGTNLRRFYEENKVEF